MPAASIQSRIDATAALLGLGLLLDRRPDDLSGGERQRTALATALVRAPRLLLLDEPLAALDTPLRHRLRAELLELHQRLGLTLILVTHDQSEAMALGQRLLVLHQGVLQQAGACRDLYRRPANTFVAQFLGTPPMQLLPGRLTQDHGQYLFLGTDGLNLQIAGDWVPSPPLPVPADCLLGLRPEAIQIPGTPERPAALFEARVEHCEGFEAPDSGPLLRLRIEGTHLTARHRAGPLPQPGTPVQARVAFEDLHWFDARSGLRLERSYPP